MTPIEHLSKVGVDANGDFLHEGTRPLLQIPNELEVTSNRTGKPERSEERHGHSNGYKPKTVQTRLGDLTHLPTGPPPGSRAVGEPIILVYKK